MSFKFYYGRINIDKLFMPRNNWDGAAYILAVLKSIKSEGLKKPLVVRKNKNKFEILLGGARYWALRKIKAKNIPCIIISEKQVLNCIHIKSYVELLKIAKVKKLWYINEQIYYEG
tara:strand:- start:602 stop:949 length:348 start_codon:yes stop_codon:yes gene_type:complete